MSCSMDLKIIIGNLATIFTIAVFLAGIEICQKIWRKKSTVDISAIPFICGLVSCSFWLRYGTLINDSALCVVNGTGLCLQIMYLIWYALYNSYKATYYKQLSCAVFVISAHFVCTSYFTENVEQSKQIAGIAACSAGVIFMASPLSSVAHVLQTRSADSIPFPMVLSTFIMATLWVYYGILTHDRFVQMPNALGALLALSQLSLFVIFRKKKPFIRLIDEFA